MEKSQYNRRKFIQQAGLSASALALLGPAALSGCAPDEGWMDDKDLMISLAQWSLNKPLYAGELDNLDFAEKARSFDIRAIEYVNSFFKDKAEDQDYLKQLNKRADDNGVRQLLIMVDGEGPLGSLDSDERNIAVENHYKWVDAAKTLGCHSIRVNAQGEGNSGDVQSAAVDGLGRLAEFAKPYEINVIVENHGGYSSHGQWLAGVMRQVDMDNCGTLPDFGNFYEYDRYQGVRDLMPFAKAVSAKSYDFNEEGHETTIDFNRMIGIVREFGYTGYIGIEYEGSRLSPDEGIRATKRLLEACIG